VLEYTKAMLLRSLWTNGSSDEIGHSQYDTPRYVVIRDMSLRYGIPAMPASFTPAHSLQSSDAL
jgi:hypothetical protein